MQFSGVTKTELAGQLSTIAADVANVLKLSGSWVNVNMPSGDTVEAEVTLSGASRAASQKLVDQLILMINNGTFTSAIMKSTSSAAVKNTVVETSNDATTTSGNGWLLTLIIVIVVVAAVVVIAIILMIVMVKFLGTKADKDSQLRHPLTRR